MRETVELWPRTSTGSPLGDPVVGTVEGTLVDQCLLGEFNPPLVAPVGMPIAATEGVVAFDAALGYDARQAVTAVTGNMRFHFLNSQVGEISGLAKAIPIVP